MLFQKEHLIFDCSGRALLKAFLTYVVSTSKNHSASDVMTSLFCCDSTPCRIFFACSVHRGIGNALILTVQEEHCSELFDAASTSKNQHSSDGKASSFFVAAPSVRSLLRVLTLRESSNC